MEVPPCPAITQVSSGSSQSILHCRQTSPTELPKGFVFFNPCLPPTSHTQNRLCFTLYCAVTTTRPGKYRSPGKWVFLLRKANKKGGDQETENIPMEAIMIEILSWSTAVQKLYSEQEKKELPLVELIALHSFSSLEEHSSRVSYSTTGRLLKSHSSH